MPEQNKPFLLIDVGNSFIKAAVYQNDICLQKSSFLPGEEKALLDVFSKMSFHSIMMLASGQSNLHKSLQEFDANTPVHQLHFGLVKSINWSYEMPETIGIDRIAAWLGAQTMYERKNICVVQLGTCMTIDCLENGQYHLGGIISPGLNMRFRSMHEFTAKLPLSSENEVFGKMGNSTLSCLASGVLYGMVAEIEYQFEAFKDLVGGDPLLVLTGGGVNNLAHRLKPSNFVAPDLVFLGMLKVLKSLI